MVLFAWRVENGVHPVGAGARHDDGVDLLRDLPDRVRELPVEQQERGDRTNRHAKHAVQCEPRADKGREHVGNVAQVHDDRHEDVGELVRFGARLAQLVVDFFKVGDRLLFVGEHLDDFAARGNTCPSGG